MVRKSIVACVCLGGLLLGAAAIAQPGDKHKPAAPAAPAAPAGMPTPEEIAKMQEAWQKSMTPGKMHAHLQKGVGKWDGKIKSWMAGPDAPPSESSGTTEITGMMGGRFTRGETKSTFDMGQGPMPFEGFGIYGFNNTTEQFECTWCDSFGTMMMHFTGKLSEDGKMLTWNSKFTDPMTNKESWMRMTETWTGPNTMTLAMFQPGADGKETKVMQIDYTRSAGGNAGGKPAMTK